jgi:hypothetical protein
MLHMLGQAVAFAALGGLPGFVWGFCVSAGRAFGGPGCWPGMGPFASVGFPIATPLLASRAPPDAPLPVPSPAPGPQIRVLFTQNMTWLVNSAVHVWGDQPWKTGDSSRNNALVALLVFGRGGHHGGLGKGGGGGVQASARVPAAFAVGAGPQTPSPPLPAQATAGTPTTT